MPDQPSTPDPSAAPDRAASARAVLLDGLAHLVDEIDLLRSIVGRIPEAVLTGRPTPPDRSLKEFYLLVESADVHLFRPAAERLAVEDGATLERMDDDALLEAMDVETPIEDVLDRITAAREALVGAFAALPEAAWRRTVVLGGTAYDGYGLAHHAVELTGERLREAGYRLHESRLTDRPQGLPK